MDELKRKIKILLTLFLVSRQLYTSPYKGSKLWEALKPTLTTQILKKKFYSISDIKKFNFSHANQTQLCSPPTKILHCPQCIKSKAWGKDRYNLTRSEEITPNQASNILVSFIAASTYKKKIESNQKQYLK